MERLMLQGLSCPQPVLKTKAYLDKHPEASGIFIVVDNRASAENVLRFLENQGFEASIDGTENAFEIFGSKSGVIPDIDAAPGAETEDSGKLLISITNDKIGAGDDELGAKLMLNFIKTLPELGNSLWRIILLNAGIKLTIDGAAPLSDLQQLEAQGVGILVCGTCLEHYGLLEKKMVGETTNMLDVVMSHQVADKIITI
jgi:selenium metabolism protein YedF